MNFRHGQPRKSVHSGHEAICLAWDRYGSVASCLQADERPVEAVEGELGRTIPLCTEGVTEQLSYVLACLL